MYQTKPMLAVVDGVKGALATSISQGKGYSWIAKGKP